MTAQIKNFLDRTGALWAQDKLVGKVGSVFTATATQHGGQESTILSTMTVLLHLGMALVGLQFQGPDADGRNHRRLAVWRFDDHVPGDD